MTDTIKVSLPTSDPEEIGGFHAEIVSTEFEGRKVIISSGYGLGHLMMYVSVDGSRKIAVSTLPLMEELTRVALELEE